MCLTAVFGKEKAGRFDDHVDCHIAPGQRRRVALGAEADAAAVNAQVFAVDRDFAGKRAVHRVVLEQIGEIVGVEQVVDRDHLEAGEFRLLGDGAKGHAPDPAEAVDCHPYRHGCLLWIVNSGSSRPRTAA